MFFHRINFISILLKQQEEEGEIVFLNYSTFIALFKVWDGFPVGFVATEKLDKSKMNSGGLIQETG